LISLESRGQGVQSYLQSQSFNHATRHSPVMLQHMTYLLASPAVKGPWARYGWLLFFNCGGPKGMSLAPCRQPGARLAAGSASMTSFKRMGILPVGSISKP